MDSTVASIFDSVWKADSAHEMTVQDIIHNISEGTWQKQIEKYRAETDKKKKENLKKRLPGVVFAGRISASGRLDKNLQDYTGIVVADIDKIPKGKMNTYKKSLMQDATVVAFFESPSMGLKVLFRADSDHEHHKNFAFKQIERHCLHYHNIVIDPSGKNPSRLCFVSYDPDMYYNELYEDFEVDMKIDIEEEERQAKMAQFKANNNPDDISYDSSHVMEVCVKFVKKSPVGGFHKGNRNNYVFALACCLNRASMSLEMAIQMIVQRYPSLGLDETTTTVSSAYKHNSNEFGTFPIYDKHTKQDKLF